MSAPRGSLRTFLTNAKSTLHNAIVDQQRVTLVIGNESADLDSITSAIVLAYLRSSSINKPLTNTHVNKHTPTSQYPPLYIPVLNIPQADIKIRPELLALLPHANIEPSHLITLDDLKAETPAGLNPDGRTELQPQLTRLLLVDHNKVAGPLAQTGFGERAVGCIDHHQDEKAIADNTGDEPRVIETCGSCTSLVTQYCRPAWDALSDSASSAGRAIAGQSDAGVGTDDDAVRRTWDAQVAKLAMASVLIDTHNLQDDSKTVDTDRSAVKYLEAKILLAPGAGSAQWDREAFFGEITTAKSDLGRLEPEEVLRKDYKQWEVSGKQLGVSSVVKPLSWQIKHAGGASAFRDAISSFADHLKLDLFSIMTTSTSDKGEFRRELLLWSVDSKHDHIVEKFANEARSELGLQPWEEETSLKGNHEKGGKMGIWWQKEIKNSRKQVAPLMRRVIESS